MCLRDTQVVSEFRKPKPHGAALDGLERIADEPLHLSAVSIGEIQVGIELTVEQDEAKALPFRAWLALVADSYKSLPMGAPAF